MGCGSCGGAMRYRRRRASAVAKAPPSQHTPPKVKPQSYMGVIKNVEPPKPDPSEVQKATPQLDKEEDDL